MVKAYDAAWIIPVYSARGEQGWNCSPMTGVLTLWVRSTALESGEANREEKTEVR